MQLHAFKLQAPKRHAKLLCDHGRHTIIDFNTLKAYSLVGRAWVTRCRSYLFEKCILNSNNILVFRDLLRSPHCTFRPHIRGINVIRNSFHLNDRCFNEIVEDLRLLIHVCTLEMMFYTRANLPDADADALLRMGFVTAFPYITHLVLTYDCGGGNSHSAPLIDMLCLFPALQVLHVRGIYGNLTDLPPSAAVPLGLHSLVLGVGAGLVLQWLNAAGHLVLQHLDITLKDVVLWSVFDLSLHPSLQTLAIRDSSKSDSNELDSNQMMALITGLAAPALESLSLDLNLALYHNLDWAALDKFLSAARFPRLRKVGVTFAGNFEGASHEVMGLQEYQVIGRHLPTESDPTPKIYRMRIFAPNEVVAKSRFWYFLRCAIEEGQKGQWRDHWPSTSYIHEKKPLKVKNFGIWLRYDSRSGTHNMYKEFRDLSRADAVKSLYQDMAARHRARFRSIHILRVVEIEKSSDVRRPYIKQLMTPNLKFPLPHRVTKARSTFVAHRPTTF
ncbi:60S ribosomal protein L20-B [Mycena venus]|uniref:60S ribosomal protein L20-B n=1 Tax=Mycena venus TaxID=2733690 RepID=A0A8H6WXC7_9AGAR|nr:60S ribosomal protein L20-B [Mycena venus]